MKNIAFSGLLMLAVFIGLSFMMGNSSPIVVQHTKWISPVNDNCYESLCFTSDKTVMYYSCEQGLYAELGYIIKGDNIEIEAYSKSSMDPSSKLILYNDDGVLRQPESQSNYFPRTFIKVPFGSCN